MMGGDQAMKKLLQILVFFLHFTIITLYSAPSHVVTIFFQPYPTLKQTTPDTTNVTADQSASTRSNTGIFVSYYGYKAISDHNGQVLFPLKQTDPSFTILVCKDPLPVFNIGNTIHHWEVPKNSSFLFYQISQFTHQKTKKVLWNVEKKELPANRAIPLNTIIIHANSEGIYLPEGVSLIQNGEQIVLPLVYVKSTITSPVNALTFLQMNDFFSPVHRVFRVD